MRIEQFPVLIYQEQIPQQGEDCLLCITRYPNAAIIGSMDGCGGAGAHRYPKAGNWTGARIASRLAGSVLSQWFTEHLSQRHGFGRIPLESLRSELERRLTQTFRQAGEILGSDSGVSSSLSKTLPTTVSSVIVESLSSGVCRCVHFWAGDSRTYNFPPAGLQQISTDNLRGGGDPFDSLMNDSILSNVVCSNMPFRIYARECILRSPCMVLTATDGCFSYFQSPILLEGLLLQSLMESESLLQWEAKIQTALGSVASDDYTMEVLLLGYDSFPQVKQAYLPRWHQYQELFYLPWLQARKDGDFSRQYAVWEEYKSHYLAAQR